VHGLQAAQRLDDLQGIQWACVGILSQAWPKEQRSIEANAFRVAEATLLRLEKQGQTEAAKKFEAELSQALVRDCIVKITWTGDADVDLLVEEPSGTICSLQNSRTTAGGVMLGDSYARDNGKSTEGYSEVYVCPQAFAGQYRMLLRRIWGTVTAGKVTVDIVTNYRAENQTHIHQQIPLAEKDAIVIFDVQNGRRTEPLDEQQVTNAVENQIAISRAILTQQLSSLEGSQAVADYGKSQRLAERDGRIDPRRRTTVGFRPVITTLPSGANLSATGVVSADRRYVRITPLPVFSSIGQVNTFNFATGSGGQTGGGNVGGGGANIIAGGAGGGGGGGGGP
jgi:hypothetical protein